MAAIVIDTAPLGKEIYGEIGRLLDVLPPGRRPRLAAVSCDPSPASLVYLRQQEKKSQTLGIEFQHVPVTPDRLADRIAELNRDPCVTGIFLQSPLPAPLQIADFTRRIDPDKDVEGVSPRRLGRCFGARPALLPCTAAAVLAIIRSRRAHLRGAEVVMVGHSDVVGKPVALQLLNQLATVTVCHIGTRDLAAHTRRAEILVVAVGKAGLIRGDMIRPGALVVDVGINRVEREGKLALAGDVAFEEGLVVAGEITPVPGGVGPLTLAFLMKNLAILAAAPGRE